MFCIPHTLSHDICTKKDVIKQSSLARVGARVGVRVGARVDFETPGRIGLEPSNSEQSVSEGYNFLYNKY